MWSFLWNNKGLVCKIGGYLILLLALAGVSFYAMHLRGVVKDKDQQITVLKVQNQEYAKSVTVLKEAQKSEELKTSEVNAQLDKCYLLLQQQLLDQNEIDGIIEQFQGQPEEEVKLPPAYDPNIASNKEVEHHEKICTDCIDFINRQFAAIN